MTAPAMPDLDTQLLEDLAVPCETVEFHGPACAPQHCDRPAAWIVRTTCHCQHVEIDLLCDRHYNLIGSSGHAFMCSGCRCINRFHDRRAERI